MGREKSISIKAGRLVSVLTGRTSDGNEIDFKVSATRGAPPLFEIDSKIIDVDLRTLADILLAGAAASEDEDD